MGSKAIEYRGTIGLRGLSSRKLTPDNLLFDDINPADKTVKYDFDRLDYSHESLEHRLQGLLKFVPRADNVIYDSSVLSQRELNNPLTSNNTSLAHAFLAGDLSSISSQEEPILQRLFSSTFSGEFLECNGTVVVCNSRFSDLLCSPKDLIIGKSAIQLLGLDPAFLAFSSNENSRYQDCEQSEFVVMVKVGEGEIRWLNCSITRYNREALRLAFGSVIDISEQVNSSRLLKAAKEKIQHLSQQIVSTREHERKRVASELHDGISQSLSAIKLNIEHYVALMLKPGNRRSKLDDEASSLGNRLVRYIQNTIEDIRRIAVDLSPSILEDLGLVQTIRWFCREFEKVHHSIKVKKHLSIKDENIPEPLKIVIYRIVQEALNNTSKHSRATEVYVEIAVLPKGLRLCVRDNGNGIKATNKKGANPRVGGMGLRSMRERAQSTGGLFKVRSMSGQGVSVHVLWSSSQIECLRRQAVVDYVSGECGYAV